MEFYLFKYIHLIGIFGVVGSLAVEWLLAKSVVKGSTLSLLAKIDGIYGVSTILVLLGGFVLWFGVGKPAEFYSANPLLYIKLGLFAVIGGLSVYPSVYFFKNRKSTEESIEVPKILLIFIRLEVILLLIIPLLAVLIADGKTSLF